MIIKVKNTTFLMLNPNYFNMKARLSRLPTERLRESLTKGNLWLYILTIMKEGEVYAYELDNIIEQRFGFKPNKIMLYLVLYKLENNGFVKSSFKERRKYYKITKKGEKELDKGKLLIESILTMLRR